MKLECTNCNYITENKSNYNKHLKTSSHIDKCKVDITKYECAKCVYTTEIKCNYQKHLNADCHLKKDSVITIIIQSIPIQCKYCGNVFQYMKNLQKHSKSCYSKNAIVEDLNKQIIDVNKKC